MPLWDYESEADRRKRETSSFRTHANRAIFRRMARSSLSKRGIDPETVPSLSQGVNLSSRDLGQISPPTSAYTPREGLDTATTYTKERVATAAVGEDYLWEQSMAEQGYTPKQIKIWKKVAQRTNEILAEDFPKEGRGYREPGPSGLGKIVARAKVGLLEPLPKGKLLDEEEAYQKAQERAARELSFEEAKEIAPKQPGGFLGWKNRLGEIGDFIGWLEKQDPALAGPFARTTEGFPVPDPEGRTSFERGAEISRPVAQEVLGGLGEVAEQAEIGVEQYTERVTGGRLGIHTRAVSGALESDIAEDILTEVINPAALVLIAPLAGQGINLATMSPRMIAAKITSNMLGTGMEPELVRGTLRTLTGAGRRGITLGKVTKGALGQLPEGWRELSEDVWMAPGARRKVGPVSIDAYADPIDARTIYVDLEGAGGGPSGIAESFREIGRLVMANPERVFKARVINERMRDILRRAGLKEMPTRMPDGTMSTKYPTFEFGVNDIEKFFPQEAAAVAEKVGVTKTSEAARRATEASEAIPTIQTYELKLKALDEAVRRDSDYVKFARSEAKAGTLSQEMLDEAVSTLSQRRRDMRKAKTALDKARIDNVREELKFNLRVNTSDENIQDMIVRHMDDSVASEPIEEVLLNASGWRRKLAWIENFLTGTPPGVSGRLAHRRDILHSAMRRYSSETADPIFKELQRLLDSEVGNIKYVGPKKWANAMKDRFKYHIIQQYDAHPDWFTGMSPTLKSKMDAAQKPMLDRLKAARALGYNVDALDSSYLEQLYEITRSDMTASSAHLPGRVSVAKPRLFDDYLTAMNQGYVPRDMSVEELMQHSMGLMDQAVSDAWMRQEMLRRFGSRVPGKVITGKVRFSHPLYKGYFADENIVNWLENMEKVVGPGLRSTADVAARFKGTVFGVVDFAVTGVQIPLSIAHGGLPGLMGTLNRSLEALNRPLVHLYAEDVAVVSRYVQAADVGVHIGWGPSSVVAKKGTIVHYVPQVGKAIDAPIAKVVDASAQAQFGVALTNVRMRIFEGNLMLLKATGENIMDPRVRRMAAEWANSITGASRGPMHKGRRALESVGLTSTQMTRANLSVYGQLFKGLGPKASKMERLRTAITFGNLFAYVYGVQYLFNSAFGDGPMEYIPGRPDWATVRVGGRTIPIIPQRSILRAVDKSLKIIERHIKDEPGGSLEDIPKAWAQVAIGKASPIIGMPLAALNIAGFEPETGQYKGGGLSTKGRIVGALPIPPLVEQAAFQERDPTTLAVAALGFNPYATSSGKMLQEQFVEDFDEEINWESPAHRAKIEDNPNLNKLWEKSKEESREYGSEAAITAYELELEVEQAELDKGIVRHAEAVLAGDALAAQGWSDARANFLPWRSGKWDERFTKRDPKTEIGQLVNEYYSFNPMDPQFTDPSGVTNWGAFREARELVLDQMPADDAKAIRDKEKFINPKVEQVDKEFRAAQDALREYWDLGIGVWERLRENHGELRQYHTYDDFKAAKAQELLNMGVPQQDIQWQLGRLPVITNIDQLIASVRFQHRLSHPDVDALRVKWYGGTPARAQGKSGYRSRGRGRGR